jgi:hypothetical protein
LEVLMSAEVIQFPSARRKSNLRGLSAQQVNAVIACSYPLIDRGIADVVEPDHTEGGAVYVAIEREDGLGWLAFKERSLYLLIDTGCLPALVSSPDFNDLLQGLRELRAPFATPRSTDCSMSDHDRR